MPERSSSVTKILYKWPVPYYNMTACLDVGTKLYGQSILNKRNGANVCQSKCHCI